MSFRLYTYVTFKPEMCLDPKQGSGYRCISQCVNRPDGASRDVIVHLQSSYITQRIIEIQTGFF
jgi:hypothetical protein